MTLFLGGGDPFWGRSSHPYDIFEGELFKTLDDLFSSSNNNVNRSCCGHSNSPCNPAAAKQNTPEGGDKSQEKTEVEIKDKDEKSKENETSPHQYLRFGPYVIRTRESHPSNYNLSKQDICSERSDRGTEEGPWEVVLPMAGCDPSRVKVEVKDGLLKVEGRMEAKGRFTYVIHEQVLPLDVPSASLKATFLADGTLKVRQDEPRIIPISVEGATNEKPNGELQEPGEK